MRFRRRVPLILLRCSERRRVENVNLEREREREKWPIQNYILIANYMSIVAAKGTNTHMLPPCCSTPLHEIEKERENGLVKQEYRMWQRPVGGLV